MDFRSMLGTALDAVEGLKEELKNLGDTEIETAGPEVDEVGYTEPDGTGAPRQRVRIRTRKAKVQKAKQTPELSNSLASLSARVNRIDADMKSFASALKAKGIAKVAGSGNRACLTATVINTAAGGTVTPANVVGNADQLYDRFFACSNTPSLAQNVTVAGNPLWDGNQALPIDSFPVGPIELAEPVKLNGNAGVGLTHVNRGAAAGDMSISFVPVGHSWGSANPAGF